MYDAFKDQPAILVNPGCEIDRDRVAEGGGGMSRNLTGTAGKFG
jgi:hypothetical protein